jgi:hypothetical protein
MLRKPESLEVQGINQADESNQGKLLLFGKIGVILDRR